MPLICCFVVEVKECDGVRWCWRWRGPEPESGMNLSSSPSLCLSLHCWWRSQVPRCWRSPRVTSELAPLPVGMPSPHSQQWHLFFLVVLFYSFLVVLGLCCCAWAFSSCGKWGLLSSDSVKASHCSGFSYCKAQELGVQALLVAAYRL